MYITYANGTSFTAEEAQALQAQGIPVFADASARDNAITTPVQGQHCHLASTHRTSYYDTTDGWVELQPGTVSGFTTRVLLVCTSTARPVHAAGRLIFETDTKKVQVSDGTAWYPLN